MFFFFQIFRRFRALDKRDVKQTTSLLSLNPRRKTRQVPEMNRPVMIVVKAYVNARAGGGGLPYETDGDARRKFWI